MQENRRKYSKEIVKEWAEYFNSEISADLMFSSENRNVLKKLIMEKGAFSIAYNAVDDEKSFLNTTTGAYFYPLDAKSNANTDTPADKINHLIAIIGWDDNFAVENLFMEYKLAF